MNRVVWLCFALAVIGTTAQEAPAASNAWGQILYTHYGSSPVYHAPFAAAAVRQRLVANETVKADFKSKGDGGGWYAVFKPSECNRSITNAVGYMEEQDLFPAPLPPGPIAGGIGNAPPVTSSIEAMTPIEPPSRSISYTSTTSGDASPPPAGGAPPPPPAPPPAPEVSVDNTAQPPLTTEQITALIAHAKGTTNAVYDAGIAQRNNNLSLVLFVLTGTPVEQARQIGAEFVQHVIKTTQPQTYTISIEVVTDKQDRLATGAQTPAADHVIWAD